MVRNASGHRSLFELNAAEYSSEMATVIDSVQILTPGLFRIGAEPAESRDEFPGARLIAAPFGDLVTSVTAAIYERFHARGASRLAAIGSQAEWLKRRHEFSLQLSQANRSSSRWDAGWRVIGATRDGQWFLQKGDRRCMSWPSQVRLWNGETVARACDVVSVFASREITAALPDFYFALGETPFDNGGASPTLRVYFHATAVAAAQLIEYCTTRLNTSAVPFGLKCLTDEASYGRTDAVVLYVARRDFAAASRLVAELAPEIVRELHPTVSRFVRRLRPGVGMGEDPGTGESFGQHRSRLVAEGLVAAWQAGLHAPAARIAVVRARFAAESIEFTRPHERFRDCHAHAV